MREHAKAVVIAALDGNVEPALLTRSAAADLSSLSLGDVVRKKSGSEWEGRVVGTYSTALTPEGYCVESSSHSGSVQIYPVGALERKP
ncbi:MAG: DfrB family trimethoprim-resistant dihydrofolate reductase [Pseudomonas sp.]|nr:MAG: DfrB family trimethoprim-resistant dihydrofolate reductase [Pseudomonas sp.]